MFKRVQCKCCKLTFGGKDRKRKMFTHMITKHYKNEFNNMVPSKVGEHYYCDLMDCTFACKTKSNFLQHLGITHNVIQEFHLGIPFNMVNNYQLDQQIKVGEDDMVQTRKVIFFLSQQF